MRHFYKTIFILSLLINFANADAQKLILGNVKDESSGNAVEYAYILNYSLQKKMYSNIRGEFKIAAQNGDTLVIYAAGYLYNKVIVNNEMLSSDSVTFLLKQQAYDLSEAKIIGIGSYDEFKQKFISLDRKKTKTENLNDYLEGIASVEGVDAYAMAEAKNAAENGVTFATVPILTPEEKERIKLAGIIEKETIRDQVYQKFNPMIVKKITGISNDEEIIEFMVFCKFSDAYLLEVNEYDLASRISLKYELFLKKKKDEKFMKDPMNLVDEIWSNFV
jgi:hypothetical protein